MSYIIAYVKFPETSIDYPVECYRTDLKPEDSVLVSLADGRIKQAVVTKLSYLNWECKSKIECKESEAIRTSEGLLQLPIGSPICNGLATPSAVATALISRGWTPLETFSYYNFVLTYSNENQTANIFFRKNGVDLQIISSIPEIKLKPHTRLPDELAHGRIVRHYLSQTSFNLFEGVLRFSGSFVSNEGNYDRFFVAVGSKDKRTSDLIKRLPAKASRGADGNDLSDLYDAFSGGSGGDAYMGDGMWISSGGRIYDGGR